MNTKNFVWSPAQLAFYPVDMREGYEAAGNWPADATPIDDNIFREFGLGSPPEGKARGVSADGMPAWVNLPAPTAEQIRRERDERLAATDWTQLPDVPAETKGKWAPYRQALRDITDQDGFPGSVDFPEVPA